MHEEEESPKNAVQERGDPTRRMMGMDRGGSFDKQTRYPIRRWRRALLGRAGILLL